MGAGSQVTEEGERLYRVPCDPLCIHDLKIQVAIHTNRYSNGVQKKGRTQVPLPSSSNSVSPAQLLMVEQRLP